MRTVAIQCVANEREAVISGYGESSSLDGLSAVTLTFQPQGKPPEWGKPMDIDAIQQDKTKFKSLCYNCNKTGHRDKECFRDKSKDRTENKAVKKDKDKKTTPVIIVGSVGTSPLNASKRSEIVRRAMEE